VSAPQARGTLSRLRRVSAASRGPLNADVRSQSLRGCDALKNALIVVALGLVGWFAYTRAVGPSTSGASAPGVAEPENASDFLSEDSNSSFSCDGREYCSQMTSCEEATYFLRNCPGVKMDGNGDGIPCERQWCGD
jgi:Excalibur calcium-binding domain